jgi:hypothetical protein
VHQPGLAAAGDEAALRRAADICDEAFLSRDGSTFDGWTELGAKRTQRLGRLERRRAGSAVKLDERATLSPCAATIRRNLAAPGPTASHSDRCSRAAFAAPRDCLQWRSPGRA